MLVPVVAGHLGVGDVHLLGVRRPGADDISLGGHCVGDGWVGERVDERPGKSFLIWGPLGPTLGGSEGFDRQRIWGSWAQGESKAQCNQNHKIPRFGRRKRQNEVDQFFKDFDLSGATQRFTTMLLVGFAPTLCGLRQTHALGLDKQAAFGKIRNGR